MPNNTSQHILNTSATLLGFCLFVITSMHASNKAANSIIDEFTSIVSLTLTVSCILSFLAIRTNDGQREQRLEAVADYFFIASLLGIMIIIVFITLNFIS